MVMAQSLLVCLRQQTPERPIDVLAPGWCKGIIERMPEVRRAIELPSQHGRFDWAMRRRLGADLRQHGFGQAYILPRSLKAAIPAWLARIPRRTGYLGEMRFGLINDVRSKDAATFRHTVRRFLYLADKRAIDPQWTPPSPSLRIDFERQRDLLEQFGIASEEPVVALLPGAEYGPAKQWPARHFADLAAGLGRAGVRCIVLGSPKEQALGEAIVSDSGGAALNLCGRTSLPDAVDLIGACRAAVSNDSGLMHVAAAVGVPVVALYGSSSSERTPPLTEQAVVMTRALTCRPCFERRCPYGHTACLSHIRPDTVLAAVAAHLPAVVK
ncbi:MAG: lipopolysaccharide heptosyltransferase II [Salinisphaeraceae bacterium]|nr:lipopolysaccharide heptosyltransferase II [Salinisphaeraceae bacterium]